MIWISFGCQKESVINSKQETVPSEVETNPSNDARVYNWYLDNILVNEGDFDPADSTLLVATMQLSENSNVFDVRAFTNEAMYIAFGVSRNLPFASIFEFERLVKIELERGEPSQAKLDEIYNALFLNQNGSRIVTIGYDFCKSGFEGNPSTGILKIHPSFGSFKKRISGHSAPISIYYGLTMWRKTWFSSRIGTYWSRGGPGYVNCFPWWFDNQSSSALKIL